MKAIEEAFKVLTESHKDVGAEQKTRFIVRSQSTMRVYPKGAEKFEKSIDIEKEVHRVLYDKMDRIGKTLKREIRSRIINENIPPPLAPETVRRKGHDHALIDTTDMLNSIDYAVKVQAENHVICEVGIFDEIIAKRATVHEFGSSRVPRRSFLRPVYDELEDEIDATLQDAVIDKIVSVWTS